MTKGRTKELTKAPNSPNDPLLPFKKSVT